MKAVLLISHGSRVTASKDEVVALLKKLRAKSDVPVLECAFLEMESPDIPEGIDLCVQKGATEVCILLNFLNSGKHVLEDIPRIVHEAKEKYPAVRFAITEPVGQHERITDLFMDLMM